MQTRDEKCIAFLAFFAKQKATLKIQIQNSTFVQIKDLVNMQLPQEFEILQTIPGFGFVIPLTILYEIGDISRFKTVGHFLSYARLVKCKHNSADKKASGGHNKIGIAETNEAEAKSKKR